MLIFIYFNAMQTYNATKCKYTHCGNVGYNDRSLVRAAQGSREVNITRIMSDRYIDNEHDLKQINSGTDGKGRV